MLNEDLLKAIKANNLIEVKALLALGASVNAIDSTDVSSGLHIAARNGYLEIVNWLLEKKLIFVSWMTSITRHYKMW